METGCASSAPNSPANLADLALVLRVAEAEAMPGRAELPALKVAIGRVGLPGSKAGGVADTRAARGRRSRPDLSPRLSARRKLAVKARGSG